MIDGAATKVLREIPTGRGAHGLYLSRDATKLYVTNWLDSSVNVLDANTGAVQTKWTIPGGASPDMGNVTADGTRLWLSGGYNRTIYVLDTADGHLVKEIPVGDGPHGLCAWPQPGASRWGTPGSRDEEHGADLQGRHDCEGGRRGGRAGRRDRPAGGVGGAIQSLVNDVISRELLGPPTARWPGTSCPERPSSRPATGRSRSSTWACTASWSSCSWSPCCAVLGLFVIYEGYRATQTGSALLPFLAALDVAIIVLLIREYRRLSPAR